MKATARRYRGKRSQRSEEDLWETSHFKDNSPYGKNLTRKEKSENGSHAEES